MAKETSGIDPVLQQTIAQMLKDVAQDKGADIDLRLKVIDRALNLEKLKIKMSEEEYGSGFYENEETT